MPEEPAALTLGEIQVLKSTLEIKAQRLRDQLHELRENRPEDWQSQFAHVQTGLVETVGKIGALNKRICSLVEGDMTTEEDYDDA